MPPALRALADKVDQSSSPASLDAGWEDLAKQVVGSSVGFPVAQLLRHAAGTSAQWRDTRLPAELKMLRSFLELDLADDFRTLGPTAAVSHFKQQLLPILGQHVIDVVLTSHEFVLRDSVNLFEDMVTGTVTHILRSLELSAIVSFRLVEEAVELLEQGVSELQQREVALEQDAERYTTEFFTALSDVTRHIRGLDAYVGAELTDWMVGQCMGPAAAAQMPSWIRDALRAIVTAAVNISSGGVLSVLGTTLGSIADLIDASAEALRLTASSPEGGLVGIQPLLEALAAGDRLPQVVIPIGFDIPNPFMPFVLPSIHIELARVPIPARALSSIVMTIVFGSTGMAPLIETLNTTATSLRVTKDALHTVHEAIAGSSAQEMRQNLQAAQPGRSARHRRDRPGPRRGCRVLGHDRIPDQGSEPLLRGSRRRRPSPAGDQPRAGHGQRPGGLRRRHPVAGDRAGLEGRLDYGETDAGGRVMLRPGPAAVVVVVADGSGVLSAQQAWHFVVQSPPEIHLELVVVPVWFPIAAGLTTPVPQSSSSTARSWADRIAGSRSPTCRYRRSPSSARPAAAQDRRRRANRPARGHRRDRACAWTSTRSRISRPATCTSTGSTTRPRRGAPSTAGSGSSSGRDGGSTRGRPSSTGRCRCCGPAATRSSSAPPRRSGASTPEPASCSGAARSERGAGSFSTPRGDVMVVADDEARDRELAGAWRALVGPEVGRPGRRTGELRPSRRL